MVEKQYSVDFFNSVVENLQRACQTLLSFNHVVELSGYLALEIDNVKKERFVLSEFVQNRGSVISESFCTKAWRTVQRQNQPRGGNITPRPTSSVYGNTLHPYDNESGISRSVRQNRTECTQIRKNPDKQEPSSHPGNKTTSSTFVGSQHGQGQGKQVFGSNPPVQNPIKKLPRHQGQGGPSGLKDDTPRPQYVPTSMKQNHQVDHGRIIVKTETDFRMGPSQTGSTHSGISSNLFAHGKMHMAQGSVGRGHPLQATERHRTSLGTNGKGSSSTSTKMMPPMQPPPASLKCDNLLRRQFCNPQSRGGTQRNTQKAPGQEALPGKAGPNLIAVSSSGTQPAKQHIAAMPQEVPKENVSQDKAAKSKAVTEGKSIILHREVKEHTTFTKAVTGGPSVVLHKKMREHRTITIPPEEVQALKSECNYFPTADVCPVLSKVPTLPKCPTTQSGDKVMPRLEQMEPLLRPLSPIVVINSLPSSLYKQPKVTLMSTASLTNMLGPVLSTADIEWEVPSSMSAKTRNAEPDADKILHGALPASVNPTPVTTTTSLPRPNIVATKPGTSGQGEQVPSNCSDFKGTLEELCLGPPAKHPKLTGKKTKEKAGKKKRRKRKSSHPRKAEHADVGSEDKEMSHRVLIGPTNRTLRSAANPVRRNYAEDQEHENDAANTDTINDTDTNTDTNTGTNTDTNTDTNTEHVTCVA